MDVASYVAESIDEGIKYARVSERLRASMEAFRPGVQGLQDLIELEPALGPEIGAAVEHLEQVLEVLNRASTFLEARFDSNQERLRRAVNSA